MTCPRAAASPRRLHMQELDAIEDEEVRHRRLVELNVIESCLNPRAARPPHAPTRAGGRAGDEPRGATPHLSPGSDPPHPAAAMRAAAAALAAGAAAAAATAGVPVFSEGEA
eukprot:gene18557-6678_t